MIVCLKWSSYIYLVYSWVWAYDCAHWYYAIHVLLLLLLLAMMMMSRWNMRLMKLINRFTDAHHTQLSNDEVSYRRTWCECYDQWCVTGCACGMNASNTSLQPLQAEWTQSPSYKLIPQINIRPPSSRLVWHEARCTLNVDTKNVKTHVARISLLKLFEPVKSVNEWMNEWMKVQWFKVRSKTD